MRVAGIYGMSCAVALACGACDSVESSAVPTAEMGILLDVEVDDAGRATALVHLTTENEALLEVTYINLEGGDQLFVSADSARRAMDERFLAGLGIYQYIAELDGLRGGEELGVSLERVDGEDALGTRVEVPRPFELTSPGATFARRDGLTLTWQGGGGADRVQVSVSSACVETVRLEVAADDGSAFLAPELFRSRPASDPAQPCAMVVEVAAIKDGLTDPAFGRGGAVHAAQTRDLELTAVP